MGCWDGLRVDGGQGGGARVFRIPGVAKGPGAARWPFEASWAIAVRRFLSPWCLKEYCCCAYLGNIVGSRYFVSIKGKGACAGFQSLRRFCTVSVNRTIGS